MWSNLAFRVYSNPFKTSLYSILSFHLIIYIFLFLPLVTNAVQVTVLRGMLFWTHQFLSVCSNPPHFLSKSKSLTLFSTGFYLPSSSKKSEAFTSMFLLSFSSFSYTVVTESRGLYIFFPSGDLEPWASSSWIVIQLSRMRRFLLFVIFFWLSSRMLLLGESCREISWVFWDEWGSSGPPDDDEGSLETKQKVKQFVLEQIYCK